MRRESPPLSPGEIHARLGRLVEPRPRHPGWIAHGWLQRLLCAGLERRETAGDAAVWPGFLALDPGPTQDTFMAAPADRSGTSLVDAAARARALAEVLYELRHQFRDQPLLVAVHVRGALAVRRPLPTGLGPPEIGILHGDRFAQVRAAGRPIAEIADEIERRLHDAAPGSPGRVGVPAVVAAGAVPLERAWHLHRQMGLEGPWMGCSRVAAQDWDVLSTRHLVVDGFGHTRIFNAWRDRMEDWKGGGDPLPPGRLDHPTNPRIPPLRFAALEQESNGLGFAAMAYAFGRALWTLRPEPTFLVPCVPNREPDPAIDWRSRRITAVLSAVRVNARGNPEPLERFEARLRADLASEDGLTGLASDGMRKLGRLPLPSRAKALLRRIVDFAAARLPGPTAHLMGSGLFSYIKMARDESSGEPRWAASWPPPYRTTDLGAGGIACTIIEQAGHRSIGIAGSCDASSFRRFLERFQEIQDSMSAPRRAEVESRHDR